MNFIDTPIRKDVVVLGGGPSGVAASVAAARTGADTAIFEGYGFFGGAVTLYGVPNWCPFTAEGGKPVLCQGIGLEILERCHASLATGKDYGGFGNHYNWMPIDPERYKLVLDDLVEESGAEVYFRSPFVGLEKEGDRIKRVFIKHHGGLQPVEAEVFIDCTGDGDVLFEAGCSFDVGTEEGKCMAPTMCFRLGNASFARFTQYLRDSGDAVYLPDAVSKAKKEGKFDTEEGRAGGLMFYSETEAGVNAGHVFDVDPLDPVDMSRAEREGRRYVQKWVQFFRDCVPGFENCVLIATGPLVGKRESRRLKGRDRITVHDYLACHKSDDDIGRHAYYIDLHPADLTKNADGTLKDGHPNVREQDRTDIQRLPEGESYGVRFGALLPSDGVSNLICAGRCISTDRTVHASLRVMPGCFVTGHAAGVAAALCADQGRLPGTLDVQAVRKVLLDQGAYLGGEDPQPAPAEGHVRG